MTISSEIKEQLKFNSDNNKLEFQNFTEIFFPHICIICRNHADKHIAKNLYSSYTSNKDYKKNYTFSLPVCDSCRNNIEMKTGLSNKSGKLLLMSIFLGLIISILLFLTLNSILLSISIFAIFIIFPARNYKIKTKSKIKFDNHLKIKINPKNPDIVELEFSDIEYAKALEEINLSQIKLKQEREAKEKQEREAKEKQEQEAKEKLQQTPDSTETQQIDENIEIEKSPVEITITEPVSGENNNKEKRKTCPKCKIEIKSKWGFCSNCGTPLDK
ncbi:MAG: hypothetical protein ACTSPU_06985 [Promethearchaeota archaeon]